MIRKIDVFPAIIFISEPNSVNSPLELTFSGPKPPKTRKVDRARVAIWQEKLHIVIDSPEGPKLVFREKITEYEDNLAEKSHHATTETGKTVVFGKDLNCGCGSRLRSWSPFGKSVYATGDPTE